jgi:hypothetical protein
MENYYLNTEKTKSRIEVLSKSEESVQFKFFEKELSYKKEYDRITGEFLGVKAYESDFWKSVKCESPKEQFYEELEKHGWIKE